MRRRFAAEAFSEINVSPSWQGMQDRPVHSYIVLDYLLKAWNIAALRTLVGSHQKSVDRRNCLDWVVVDVHIEVYSICSSSHLWCSSTFAQKIIRRYKAIFDAELDFALKHWDKIPTSPAFTEILENIASGKYLDSGTVLSALFRSMKPSTTVKSWWRYIHISFILHFFVCILLVPQVSYYTFCLIRAPH